MATYKEGELGPDGITIENTLNREDGSLPFGLYCPETNGKLTWICNMSQDNNIVGVFNMDLSDHAERMQAIYKDLAEAIFVKDELIKSGWQLVKPPKIEFTVGGDGKPLNRRERRELSKKIKEMQKDMRDNGF
jgi:hypothetical protein